MTMTFLEEFVKDLDFQKNERLEAEANKVKAFCNANPGKPILVEADVAKYMGAFEDDHQGDWTL